MSSAMGLAKLGSALRQNWLLALLVLLQSVLNIKTQHGLGLVLILAAQLGSAWLLYGKPGVYVAKIYCFALSVLALVLVLTDFKMDFIFNSMKSDLAWFFIFQYWDLFAKPPVCLYDFEKKAFCCIMESSDNDIFLQLIASFTTFVAFLYIICFLQKRICDIYTVIQ